jgi:hypothetical protein
MEIFRHTRGATELRDQAFAEFDEQDFAAGRPLLTSVVLDGKTMRPQKFFFRQLERYRGVVAKTAEEKDAAHLVEFNAAKAFDWTVESAEGLPAGCETRYPE